MVIIAAGPLTLRKRPQQDPLDATPMHAGRHHGDRERHQQHADQRQAGQDGLAGQPSACSVPMAMNEPTMKTLKWAKLISSRMP